ncbi:MAG: flagellar protein FlaG [Bacillota bacterium]|nr:flagellar protein FlaG [Bacillota bacterium]
MEVEAVVKPHAAPALNPPPVTTSDPEAPDKVDTGATHKPEKSMKARAEAAANAPERGRVDKEQLQAVLDKLNIVLNALDIQARFSVHEATKRVWVRVVNVETGKLIREIPPKRILDMAAKMMELVGLLLDERA